MQIMEMESSYVNEPPRQKPIRQSQQFERRWVQILLLSFGLLCLLQATLNVTLRLTANCESNTTVMETELNNQINELNSQNQELNKQKQECIKQMNELHNQINRLNNQLIELVARDQLRNNSGMSICPSSWRDIRGRCYFLSSEKRSWESSRMFCQDHGADLVVINDEQEQRDLYGIYGDPYLLFWIGLHNDTSRGTFKWVDDTPLTRAFWQVGQPDAGGLNNQENCVEMYCKNPVLASWNDAPCGHLLQWICEKAACR